MKYLLIIISCLSFTPALFCMEKEPVQVKNGERHALEWTNFPRDIKCEILKTYIIRLLESRGFTQEVQQEITALKQINKEICYIIDNPAFLLSLANAIDKQSFYQVYLMVLANPLIKANVLNNCRNIDEVRREKWETLSKKFPTSQAEQLLCLCAFLRRFHWYFLPTYDCQTNTCQYTKAPDISEDDMIRNLKAEGIRLWQEIYDGFIESAFKSENSELTQELLTYGAHRFKSSSVLFEFRHKIRKKPFVNNGCMLKVLGAYYPEESLIMAVRERELEVVNHLISKKINLDIKDAENNTPLIIAVSNGDLDITKALIAAGASLNYQNYFDSSNSALIIAVQDGNVDIAQELINAKADLNLYNRQYETPLSIALKNRDFELVNLLLQCKAEVTPTAYSLIVNWYREAIQNNNLEMQLFLAKYLSLGEIVNSNLPNKCVIS